MSSTTNGPNVTVRSRHEIRGILIRGRTMAASVQPDRYGARSGGPSSMGRQRGRRDRQLLADGAEEFNLRLFPQRVSDAAYAAKAIMSSSDSFSTTGFMSALFAPARV